MITLLLPYFGPEGLRTDLMRRHGARLREEGVSLVLADDAPAEADAAHFHEVVALPPAERVGEAVAAMERYAAARRLDGILIQSEAALLPGALLAARLGLSGIPIEAAHRCANKWLCREALRRAGVPQPRHALAKSAADVLSLAERFPVILKGVASTMGRNVVKVDRPAGVEESVRRIRGGLRGSTDIARLRAFVAAAGADPGCDPLEQFLVEEYVEGAPVETDGVVSGARVACFGVTEQVLTPPPRFYIEGYLLPTDRRERAAIEAVSEAALAAVGARDCGFSIEMRSDGATARVIEINGRLGEDDGFQDLFRAATGGDPFLHAVDVARGRPVTVDGARGPRWALAYRSCYEAGVVASVPGEGEVDGVRIGVSVYPGARLHPAGHPQCFPHLAWGLAGDPASSRAAYERARAAVAALPFDLRPA